MPIVTKVADVMSKRIVSVDVGATVWEATDLMVRNDIGSVLVRKDGKYVGIVTERDVLKKVTLKKLDPVSVKTSQIMSSPLVTIDSDQGLGHASLLMVEHKIRRLPVVEKEEIVGVLTERDLNRASLDALFSLARID